MTKTIVLLTILISTMTYAEEICPINEGVVRNLFYNKDEISKEVACSKGKDIAKLLQVAADSFQDAPQVSVHLINEFDNASYDNGSLIKVPVHFYSLTQNNLIEYKDQRDLDAIILHEYGHAILANELAKSWEGFNFYNRLGHKISDLKQQAFIKDSERLQKQIKRAEKDLMGPRAMRTFTKAITPFQELFADVLSTFIMNNKSAITHAIETSDDNEMITQIYRTRDFNQVEVDLIGPMINSHGHFYKVRQFIGNSFWPKNLMDRKEKLNILLRLFSQEIQNAFYYTYFMEDLDVDNGELIQRIQELISQGDHI